jgi:thioredoxin reductase/NAD-dependent dihydropyrimidine dehydrogenase PreA subunit
VSLTLLVVLTGLFVLAVSACGALVFFAREDKHRELLKESIAAGLNQPANLHPVVNHDVCMGSGACVDACPESVLGIIDGVTQLVKAGDCIGHGRCHDSCPTRAIALVFGTAERGVDIPLLRAGYETNVDGIFVVGELGGMGLIRNAMRQGMQAAASIQRLLERPGLEQADDPDAADVLIVGAGPAGIACAVKCVELGLSFELVEQYALGGSVMHYPRRKLVFTEVIKLPIVGRFGKTEMLKEELVAEFERVCLAANIEVREGTRVSAVKGRAGKFLVETDAAGAAKTYTARSIVLAVGRRGTPRKLECPGEDLPHVVYRLQDAEQYRHRRVLVVGGGDSAVEAAVALAQVAGTIVHLSYRGDSFYRVKKKNRTDLEAELAAGRIQGHLETTVVEVGRDFVKLESKSGTKTRLEVDDVIVNIGGVLPTAFLESMGVRVETKRGEEVVGESQAKVIAERITARFTKAQETTTKFAKAGGDFVKTASQRVTGRISGDKKRPTARTARPSAKAPKPDPLTTTDDLTPFESSSDKAPPPRTRPDPTGGPPSDELTPLVDSDANQADLDGSSLG